jgi:hypothetical protein
MKEEELKYPYPGTTAPPPVLSVLVMSRGVRQGDLLSPLMYVLGGDVLQSMVNDLLFRD